MKIEPLPIPKTILENYRIQSRYQNRPGMIGGHQMRRKGQSLEFHEYKHYVPGDDIRHVDWRASSRYGKPEDLLVRTFTAEEQLTIIISIDTRDSMHLPEKMSKLLIANWLTEAISWIALRSEDRIILHRLFGTANGSIQEIYGASHTSSISQSLKRFLSYKGQLKTANTHILEKYLKPAVVWIIISDFYFDMNTQGSKLVRYIAQAQDGMRWIILFDTDSWPYEKLTIGQGPRKIEGPDLPIQDLPLEINSPGLLKIESEIDCHKQILREKLSRGSSDYISWKWPSNENPDPKTFFEDNWGKDKTLRKLFMKEL